jgi:hypothetical protein
MYKVRTTNVALAITKNITNLIFGIEIKQYKAQMARLLDSLKLNNN